MSFKASVCLSVFCVDVLSVDVSVVLQSPAIIVYNLLLILSRISLMYGGSPMLGVYIYL